MGGTLERLLQICLNNFEILINEIYVVLIGKE